jgi:hypothetical protein
MAHAAKSYVKPSCRSKKMKRRNCLRCDCEFWSEGSHHRLRQTCRQVIAASPSPVEEYSVVSLHEGGVTNSKLSGRPWLWQGADAHAQRAYCTDATRQSFRPDVSIGGG